MKLLSNGRHSFLFRAGTLAFIAYLAWLGWNHLGPHKPEVGPQRCEVAELIVPQVVEGLRADRRSMRTAALVHFVNDPSDFVTSHVRTAIEQAGILNLHERTVTEKLREVMSVRHPSTDDVDAAVERGKSLGVEAVIFGRVNSFENVRGGAAIDMDVFLVEVASGTLFSQRNYRQDKPGAFLDTAALQEGLESISVSSRFLSWAAIVLLLPVFSITFIRAMVRKESNRTNAFTLATYTGVDAIVAWLMLGAALTGWFSVLLFIAAVGGALAYNYHIMNFALRLES